MTVCFITMSQDLHARMQALKMHMWRHCIEDLRNTVAAGSRRPAKDHAQGLLYPPKAGEEPC